MVSAARHPGEEYLGPVWRVIRIPFSVTESQRHKEEKTREGFLWASVVDSGLKSIDKNLER
jgi:hypothetical protein